METSWQTSGSCLVAIKLCLAVVVCLSAMGYQSTEAANCTAETNFTCVATDLTLSTCNSTSLTCGCKANMVAIPTGCAVKLAQPNVKLEAGRSFEFIPGATVKLTCDTSDVGVVTFGWKKNGQALTSVTTAVYEISGSDTDKAGSFTCVTMDGPEVSDESPAMVLKATATAGPTSAPNLVGIPTDAAKGVTIASADCKDIPYGATFKFKVGTNPPTEKLTFDDSAGTSVTCVLDASFGFTNNAESAVTPWPPKDAPDISKASISPASQSYKTGTQVVVSCETEPKAMYMEVGTKKMAYAFQDTGNTSTAIGNTYTVTPATGTHTITCTASYDGKPGQTSDHITLTFSDDYVKAPVLNASQETVKPGGQLVLTCGDVQSSTGVVYSWTKDGATIFRQKDRIIQYGNFQKTDAGTFTCTAARGISQATSNVVTVKSRAHSLQAAGSVILVLVALTSSRMF